jgi:serine/threonine-protein kinase
VVITGDAPVAATPDAPPRHATIAVMPFANMSADADAEYFSDGMSEEILNALVRIAGLRVIARTSSFALKGTDARQVGERLGAGVVVEGSVRKAGARIRVTAQLIDTASGVQLWSERFDRELSDVFAVQDEITAAVRDALSEKLAGIGALPRAKPVIDADTYEMFLRARHLINKPPDGLVKGAELMQQVVERAPTYAPALSELSQALTLLSNFGIGEPMDVKPRADELARQAIEHDPTDPVPYAILGHNALHYHYDWAASTRHFDRALALGPSHPVALSWTSFYSASIGRFTEATAESRRAVTLDPLNLTAGIIDLFVHHFARRWNEVIVLSERMAEVDPNFSEAYRIRSYALMKLGRLEEAHSAAETAARLSGGHPYHLFHVALTHLAAGRRAAAEAIAAQFESAPASQSVYDILVCNLNGPLGNHDKAFAALERYFARKGHWIAMMQCDPLYDAVRADPRFDAMLKRARHPVWEGPPQPVA